MNKFFTNIVPLATILYGIAVIILLKLGFIVDPQFHILTLVTFIAVSEYIERTFIIKNIEKKVNKINTEITKTNGKSEVITFTSENEAVSYIDSKTKEAKKSIWRASLDNQSIRNPTQARINYWDNREERITKNDVTYRYVTILYEDNGLKKLERYNDFVNIKKLSKFHDSFYIMSAGKIPILSFIIIDEEELFTRAPIRRGREDEYVVIRSKEVIELFKKYYDDLFDNGISIKDDGYQIIKDKFLSIYSDQ